MDGIVRRLDPAVVFDEVNGRRTAEERLENRGEILDGQRGSVDDPLEECRQRLAEPTVIPLISEFKTLVQQLDQVTADECGFPIVSAWASILEPVDQLPCWVETGIPYPAYAQANCT